MVALIATIDIPGVDEWMNPLLIRVSRQVVDGSPLTSHQRCKPETPSEEGFPFATGKLYVRGGADGQCGGGFRVHF